MEDLINEELLENIYEGYEIYKAQKAMDYIIEEEEGMQWKEDTLMLITISDLTPV